MRLSANWLLLLIFFYFVIRLLLILTVPEAITDELYIGALAMEFLEGLRLPLWDYSGDPYGTGILFSGMLTAPLFHFFGNSIFVLKLVPLILHLLSLIAWFFVFRPHFSQWQTFWMLLFLVIPPPQSMEYMLLNNGYHFVMILWMALSIILFRRILENGGPASIFLLGLLGGFSTSLIPTNLITVATIFIYLMLTRNLFRQKMFFVFYGFGFLIGFIPWILLNVHNDWRGFESILAFFSSKAPFLNIAKNFLKLFLNIYQYNSSHYWQRPRVYP